MHKSIGIAGYWFSVLLSNKAIPLGRFHICTWVAHINGNMKRY